MDQSCAENPSITFEEVISCSQKYISIPPVVVLGTGATIPHGLPSMQDLTDVFIEKTVDLQGWQEFIDCLKETNDLESALSEIDLPPDTVKFVIDNAWDAICKKDIEFFDNLCCTNSSFPLARLFSYLITTSSAFLSVITTNYDRLAEYAANYIHAYVSTGITDGWYQHFEPSILTQNIKSHERRTRGYYEGHIRILKVHGSLDWFKTENGMFRGIPLSRRIPAKFTPQIITPGTSKYQRVLEDPFRTILSRLDDALKQAQSILCIGYGFNDEHVQPKLIAQVKEKDVPLILVTKKITKSVQDKFLSNPPKKFIFFEEGKKGTRVFTPQAPQGMLFPSESVWILDNFVKMILGEKRD